MAMNNSNASYATIEKMKFFDNLSLIADPFRNNVLSINATEGKERTVARKFCSDLTNFFIKPSHNNNKPIPTEQPLDLSKSSENRHAGPSMIFPGLNPPIVSPQTQNNSTLKRELDVDNSDNTKKVQPRKKIKTKAVASNMTDLVRNFIESNTIVEGNDTEYVKIGTNGTKVQKEFLQQLNWNGTGAAITRKLLAILFDRQTLATHTITGKPSPAFLDMNKPKKGQLNPVVISDVIELIVHLKGATPREVKIAISTKCADEGKHYRRHQPTATITTATAKSEENVITAPEAM